MYYNWGDPSDFGEKYYRTMFHETLAKLENMEKLKEKWRKKYNKLKDEYENVQTNMQDRRPRD